MLRTLILLFLLFPTVLRARQNLFEDYVVGQWEAVIEGLDHIALMNFTEEGLFVIVYTDVRLGEYCIVMVIN